ncbi:hypothetical protein ES711_05305 [Gelidibacter salicanalis]|uniref:Uncharacterized protein n=1 Tax=Gelidibacter salicanalis TaxID=291193 RepID=A0A5C7ALS3_9FLAO|nr:hypothetical protein [Gelidibacter salicanalis]TXE09347.1 hypothetical protein ES711_05305 [Gelidibacter salicanalis]
MNDTILFSGISYQPKEIVITKVIADSQNLTVYLEELVTILDEVVVGKILTGDLIFDLKNTPIKPEVNFFNLGIPGYTGKPKTQSERRLYEATSGGGFIPLNPILNAISGRTNELKNQVSLERLDNCLDKLKSQFSEILFAKSNLDESLRIEFFYYCQDDLRFERVCKVNNGLETFEFLEAKLKSYKDILRSQKN